jgi:hypothetical protein
LNEIILMRIRIHSKAGIFTFLLLLASITILSIGTVRAEPPKSTKKYPGGNTNLENRENRYGEPQPVVCDKWTPIILDGFEYGFPGAGWTTTGSPGSYRWGVTGCARAAGQYSLWCAAPLPSCGGFNQSEIRTIAEYAPIEIPEDTEVVFLSFDYLFGGPGSNDRTGSFCAGLLSSHDHWKGFPPPYGEWTNYNTFLDMADKSLPDATFRFEYTRGFGSWVGVYVDNVQLVAGTGCRGPAMESKHGATK